MISSGAQIKAARALIGWKQKDLAAAAELHEKAVAYWERFKVVPRHRGGPTYGLHQIERALREAGVETFIEPTPGVRFISHRQKTPSHTRQSVAATITADMSAAEIIATLKRSGTVH